MKRFIVETLTILILSFVLGFVYNMFSDNSIPIFPKKIKKIEYKNITNVDSDIVEYYLNDDKAIIIDARDKGLYSKSHIKNAINIPLNEFEKNFKNYEKLLQSKSIVIVYCSSRECDDSLNLALRITNKLKKSVLVYKNGFKEWKSLKKQLEYEETY